MSEDLSGVFPKCFTKFAEFSDKNICHYSKRARTFHPVTPFIRDQDATTIPPLPQDIFERQDL